MANPGDCTAIIMAAGTGSRMTDLTSQCTKALLPVGRYPMIWYPVRMLEKAGFSVITIIARQSWQKQIHNSLSNDSVQVRAHIDMVGIPDAEDWDTADALRHVVDKIKTMAIVVSCDIISDCDLSELMSVHRKHNSVLTVMLSQLPSSILADTLVPGFKPKQKNSTDERTSIGFESRNMDHVVFWKAHVDMDDEYVSFSKKFLNRFPCTRIQSSWADCSVYIINKFVLKYLKERKDIGSVAGDLIPEVVKKQMAVYVANSARDDADMSTNSGELKADKKKDLIDFAVEARNDTTNSVKYLSLTSNSFGMSDDAPQKDLIRCHAYRQTEGFCVRANTIGAYFEACKQIPRLLPKFLTKKQKDDFQNVPQSTTIKPKSQIGADCLLGESATIGEKVSVKKSVIGSHCKIGDKVKITNSVIMDHVNIQESCIISNCIVANSTNIGDKCELSNCIIEQNQNISTMSKHTNEVLSNVSQLMEITLE